MVKNKFALIRRGSNRSVRGNEGTLLVAIEYPDEIVFLRDDVMPGGKLLTGNGEGKRDVNHYIPGFCLARRDPHGREHSCAENNPKGSYNFPPEMEWTELAHWSQRGKTRHVFRRNAV